MIAPHRIRVASASLQILLERFSNVQYRDNVLDAKRFLLINSQSLGSADRVFDLPTIEVTSGESLIIIVTEFLNLDAFNSNHFVNEGFPDTLLGFVVEFAVAESDVDARLEGLIKGLYSVCGQEQDALEILEKSEKDADECISSNVLRLASFWKQISLMNQGDFFESTYLGRRLPRPTARQHPKRERRQEFY